jgi:hypothetical protein
MGRFAALDAVVRMVETGSLSAAARQLQVGQPAVSKTIAQLETRAGWRLLFRTTHKLPHTEAGPSVSLGPSIPLTVAASTIWRIRIIPAVMLVTNGY